MNNTHIFFFLSLRFWKNDRKVLYFKTAIPKVLCSDTRCLQLVLSFSSASCGSTETSSEFIILSKWQFFSILFSIHFALRVQRRAVHAFLYTAGVFSLAVGSGSNIHALLVQNLCKGKSHSAGKPAH